MRRDSERAQPPRCAKAIRPSSQRTCTSRTSVTSLHIAQTGDLGADDLPELRATPFFRRFSWFAEHQNWIGQLRGRARHLKELAPLWSLRSRRVATGLLDQCSWNGLNPGTETAGGIELARAPRDRRLRGWTSPGIWHAFPADPPVHLSVPRCRATDKGYRDLKFPGQGVDNADTGAMKKLSASRRMASFSGHLIP
jgi:hypothetical protein